MDYAIDKRKHRRCPACSSINVYFKLDPLPYSKSLVYACADCSNEFLAKREEDKHEFKQEADKWK